jgi:hypothetical protein
MLLAMSFFIRTLIGAAISTFGLIAAAGAYAEATRVPDQP